MKIEVENVIKNLKDLISGDCTGNQYDFREEIETAIIFLGKLEKEKPKKPLHSPKNKYKRSCPRCGFGFCHKEEDLYLIYDCGMYRYCPECGQRIKWWDK